MRNFQRKGASSNAQVGRDFETRVEHLLEQKGLHLYRDFKISCGVAEIKKVHKFDLGADDPKVIVECKSHTWTETGGIPYAKLKNWVEAMFYFQLAPAEYRKIFVVEKSIKPKTGETLLSYFNRTQAHFIPEDVELWEVDIETNQVHICRTFEHDRKVSP